MRQEPKFEVECKTEEHVDDYERSYTVLVDVHPESLTAQCPHCGVYAAMKLDAVVKRGPGWKFDLVCSCPGCGDSVFAQTVYHETQPAMADEHYGPDGELVQWAQDAIYAYTEVLAVYPPGGKDILIAEEVPERYTAEYREAALVLDISPNASAALSRRVLQNLLREEYGIEHYRLVDEIDEFTKRDGIPSYLVETVDAIRNIGNFAAHPTKDTNTGEIVEVEPGEAGWLIEILDALFDFTFVQPSKIRQRRERLNEKLDALGRKPMR